MKMPEDGSTIGVTGTGSRTKFVEWNLRESLARRLKRSEGVHVFSIQSTPTEARAVCGQTSYFGYRPNHTHVRARVHHVRATFADKPYIAHVRVRTLTPEEQLEELRVGYAPETLAASIDWDERMEWVYTLQLQLAGRKDPRGWWGELRDDEKVLFFRYAPDFEPGVAPHLRPSDVAPVLVTCPRGLRHLKCPSG